MTTYSIGDRVVFRGADSVPGLSKDKRYHGVVTDAWNTDHEQDELQYLRIKWDDGMMAQHYSSSVRPEEAAQ